MINRVVLTGRLVADPELKVTQSNISVVNFRIAVQRPFTSASGDRESDFINVVAFRKVAENINQYLSKGSQVGIDGRLQTRTYENKEGQTVYVTEVVAEKTQFLDSKSKESSGGGNYRKEGNKPTGGGYGSPGGGSSYNTDEGIRDDDLPF